MNLLLLISLCIDAAVLPTLADVTEHAAEELCQAGVCEARDGTHAQSFIQKHASPSKVNVEDLEEKMPEEGQSEISIIGTSSPMRCGGEPGMTKIGKGSGTLVQKQQSCMRQCRQWFLQQRVSSGCCQLDTADNCFAKAGLVISFEVKGEMPQKHWCGGGATTVGKASGTLVQKQQSCFQQCGKWFSQQTESSGCCQLDTAGDNCFAKVGPVKSFWSSTAYATEFTRNISFVVPTPQPTPAPPTLVVDFYDEKSTLATDRNWGTAKRKLMQRCIDRGYKAGIPTGHHAIIGGNHVRGVFCVKGDGVDWHDARTTFAVETDWGAASRAIAGFCGALNGYITGVPNGHQAAHVRGCYCFKEGPFIQWYDIPATFNTRNNNWGDAARRSGDWCKRNGWQWGFPNGHAQGNVRGVYCFKTA